MYYKKKNTNVIIIVLIAAIVIVVLSIVGITINNFVKNARKKKEKDVKVVTEIEPTITVKKLIKEGEKDLESVTLLVEAKTDDEAGIELIENINNKETFSKDKVEVTVTENGKYQFKATGKNGKIATTSIDVTEIKVLTADEPYIPEGFKHVLGTVEEGYVIEDKDGNQFVWIPVPEKNLLVDQYETASANFVDERDGELNNSITKNLGFYISRFEISAGGKNGNSAASVKGKKPWTNVSYVEAKTVAESMSKDYGYKDISTMLPTGKSWSKVLSWIDKTKKTYSKSLTFGNYDGGIKLTGTHATDEVNHIFDLAGNVKEWTEEKYVGKIEEKNENSSSKPERVLRGGSGNKGTFTPSKRFVQNENDKLEYWGFRIIMYSNLSTGPAPRNKEKQDNNSEQKKNNDNKSNESTIQITEQDKNKDKKDNNDNKDNKTGENKTDGSQNLNKIGEDLKNILR